jgi:tRNA pseudouridine55 synthase
MELPEILLIDKPKGITSFDVIRILRKETGIRKFGHAGTLDPLASGLMILGVNNGTKKLSEYIKLDKEYVAEIRIGERRTTGDLEGAVAEEKEVETLSRIDIESALVKLVGSITLPVSAYSAIKKEGTPLYKKARAAERKGETIDDLPLRVMEVFKAELIKEYPEIIEGKKRYIAQVSFHVGSGTYIRSLAEELGRLLGYPATLQGLRRTKIGEFKVEDARHLDIRKEAS